MFLLVLLSLAMGFVLIGVLVFAKPSRPAVEREGGPLVGERGLVVSSYARNRPRELEIAAVNPQPITGGDFVVHCTHPEDGFVAAARVNLLRDQVKGEQAAKGIFITTGFFAEEVSKVVEGPPLELINAKRLRELMRDYRLAV